LKTLPLKLYGRAWRNEAQNRWLDKCATPLVTVRLVLHDSI